MRTLIARHKIVLVLFALWLFVAYVFFLRLEEKQGLVGQVTLLQQEIAVLPQPAADRRMKDMGETFSWIDSMPDFLMDLTKWAKKRSIVIVTIEPEKTDYKEGYIEQPVKLELQGRFRTIGEYLTFLEDLPRPVQVTGLQITSPETVAPDILARLNLVVYIRDAT